MKRRKIIICIIILLILAIAFLLIDIYVGKLVDLHPSIVKYGNVSKLLLLSGRLYTPSQPGSSRIICYIKGSDVERNYQELAELWPDDTLFQ